MDFYDILQKPEYQFLKTHPRLGKNIILLGISGSYSYGTNNENSDFDLRGVMLNQKTDLVGMTKYEQYVDEKTDTTIYTFNKIINLLLSCNPNTIELLGLKQEHYIYLSPIGKELLMQKELFLSKRAIYSFGGYASQQLRRLQNALARDSFSQAEKEKHIYESIKNAMYEFKTRYHKFEEGSFHIYVDNAVNPDLEAEMFVDVDLTHYPLRDYRSIWSEINNIVKDYEKIGKRNKKKDDDHLNKHAMHLIRLFMMAIDILEKGEINTYREEEHELLLSIRRGDFQKENKKFSEEFYKLLAHYENRLNDAAEHTSLPDEPDYRAVEKFMMKINEQVVRDEI